MVKADLLIVIQGNKVSFFQKTDQYALLTLDGLNEFDCPDLTEGIPNMLERFADKLNLESAAEISAAVFSAENHAAVSLVIAAIKEKTSCKECGELDYSHPLTNVIHCLRGDNSLEIDSFGVNFGANNYKIVNGTMHVGPYNLLAYTVSRDLLVEHITD